MYLDLSRAFDKFNIEFMGEKLSAWAALFLMIVQVGSEKSQWVFSNRGVLQGSVLGSILFLMCVNELCKYMHSHCLFSLKIRQLSCAPIMLSNLRSK